MAETASDRESCEAHYIKECGERARFIREKRMLSSGMIGVQLQPTGETRLGDWYVPARYHFTNQVISVCQSFDYGAHCSV